MKQAGAADSRLQFIDIATPMLGSDELPLPDIFLEDKLHLNPLGYEIRTREVRRVIVDREAAWE